MRSVDSIIFVGLAAALLFGSGSTSFAGPIAQTRGKSHTQSGASFDGIQIEIKNDPLGRLTWYISPRGAKIISPIAAMIAAPPSGHLIVFNPETKKYYESPNVQPVKHAMVNYQTAINQKKFHWSPWKKLDEETLSGMKCQHYKRVLLSPPVDKNRGLTSSFVDEAWVSDIDERKGVKTYLMPLAQIFSWDMPFDSINLKRISIWDVYQNGKLQKSDPKQEVTLISVKKRKFTADDFQLPQGYKSCHQLSDVMPDDMSFGMPR
jgi:hypothetical protein